MAASKKQDMWWQFVDFEEKYDCIKWPASVTIVEWRDIKLFFDSDCKGERPKTDDGYNKTSMKPILIKLLTKLLSKPWAKLQVKPSMMPSYNEVVNGKATILLN